ncbi:replication factor C subunit 3 isoform X4 [Cryptomeria japonica]|uniref:replication factor C subunit 3 isoform X4 n=1 Tax=Cryptomeria japonica TaxID=3369 RepID=UPI0027DA5BC1|nr:replication factor C subunit 3 isoform X4 [Cryptomeria japonica]
MLWVDKYRPRSLDKIIVHREIADNLKNLVSEHDCPHLLFYGPPGAGKKTLIIALLKQIFGPGAEKVKVENRPWKIERCFSKGKVYIQLISYPCLHQMAGTRTIEVELTTVSSNYHVELNPSDVGFQDKYVVQEIIKEMAKSRPIDINGNKGYKVLVLNEVDKLSKEAQHSLRRTMELYSGVCRIILCCNSASKVIEAVRSRCLNVRINAPSKELIIEVLEYIAKKEGLQLPIGFAGRIAIQSERNLRRAILCFETCRVQQLFMVRGKIYDLLVNCIPPEVVLKRLVFELMKKLDSELKHEVCHWAAYYEHRMHLGQKAIFHIEAFIAKFMSIYKKFLIATFG